MERWILVVEDDPNMQRLVRAILREDGYQVECVGTTQAAEQALAQRTYRGMVLDYRLPGEDGISFVRRAAPLMVLPPTLIITGDDPALLQHALASPCITAILAKPFTLEQFFTLTQTAFGGAVPTEIPRAAVVGESATA